MTRFICSCLGDARRPGTIRAASSTEAAMTLDDFKSQLTAALRDAPLPMTADITDFAVAFWNGRQVVYAYLRDDNNGLLDDEFDLTDNEWQQWHEDLAAWLRKPVFTVRPDVERWLKKSPPESRIDAKDGMERRALLLHLGDVMEAIACVM